MLSSRFRTCYRDRLIVTIRFFSYSYKRMQVWRNILSNSQSGNDKLRRLQKIGSTRWNSKSQALKEIFHEVENSDYSNHRFKHLVEALHFFGFNKDIDPKTATTARDLLSQWQKFETILTAFIFLQIFKITTPVSRYLQTKNLDYVLAWNQITKLIADTDDLSGKFADILKETQQFVEIIDNETEDFEHFVIELQLPEKRKKTKKGLPGELASDEVPNDQISAFRVNVFRVIFDNLKMTLKTRYEKMKNFFKHWHILILRGLKT